MAKAAAHLHDRTGRTGGNGSLMRTSPVALAHLGDERAIVEAATAISALTHTDERAGEACALWSLAINHAVLEGEFNLRAGLPHLSAEAQTFWSARIDEAESRDPSTFTHNGYVVTALQAAWSAIHHTPVPLDVPVGTSSRPSTPRSASRTTWTRSPRSRVDCWVPGGAPRRSPRTGVRSSTATRTAGRKTSSSSPSWRWPVAAPAQSLTPTTLARRLRAHR